MKQMKYFILFFLFILIIMAPLLQAQNSSCLKGTVIDGHDNHAIAFVSINVSSVYGTTSNQSGLFELCNLPSAEVKISVSCLGYRTLDTLIKSDNYSANIQLKLWPALIEIEEVVVTATRTDNYVLETPVRVNLISPKFIASSPVRTIDEILKYSPGVNWSRPFGIFSTKAIVTMRGLSGKEQGRVMVLLDGIPINKSDGGTVDWNMIDMETVRKVEITKGAGSALYGGNAMGGVINILTQPPAEKLYARAALEYGTFNTIGARVMAGGNRKLKSTAHSVYWGVSTFYRKSDGYITQSEADQLANPYIIKSNLMEFGINARTGIKLGENHRIEAIVNYYNDHRGTGEKVHLEDGNVTDHDSYGITLNYKGKVGSLNINSSLFGLTENYKKVNEYLKDDYTWYDVLSVRRDMGWISTVSKKIGKSHLITSGLDYKNGSVDAYDKYFTSTDIVYNEGRMHTFAVYAQDEISLLENRFRLIAGIRYDRASFYDGSFRIENPSPETSFMNEYEVPDMPEQNWGAISPRLSLQYKLSEKSRIYVMYSRGFRPSVLDDLCRSGRIKGGFKIANPSLQPEYLDNYELGADWKPINRVQWNASFFYSKGKDFQYYVSNGQTIDMGFGDRPIFIRANISDVEMAGVETELRFEVNSQLQLFANYCYSKSRILEYRRIDQNDTIDLAGKFFTDVPEHILSAGASWNHPFVNLSLLYHYNGAMYVNDRNTVDEVLLMSQYPAYSTVDIKVWKEFMGRYKASLFIQNAFDTKYYDSKYAVCPGRFITAEISFKL
jgi:iron complex outermembrane receptor protein